MNKQTPARSNVVVLKQLLNLIPLGMVNRHAREITKDYTGITKGLQRDYKGITKGLQRDYKGTDNMIKGLQRDRQYDYKGTDNIAKILLACGVPGTRVGA